MSKKTIGLIVGLLVTTVVLLFVALSAKQPVSPQATTVTQEERPAPTPVAHTMLMLSPDTVQIGANGSGSVDVMIDTGGNQINAIQLEVAYDPEILKNVVVTPGTFLPTPLKLFNNTDQENGRISFALGVPPSQDPVTGTGTVATIRFTRVSRVPTGTTDTEIELLPKTQVTALGISTSVLKSATGATVMLSAQ